MSQFDAPTVDQLRARGSLKWTMHGARSLGAWVAEMDFGAAPQILQALHAAVDTMNFGYLPPGLEAAMAAACAEWAARRYGWEIPAEDIHAIPDVLRGLEIAIEHFSRPGSPVILPVPAYMPFLTIPPRMGREFRFVPMVPDGGRHVLDLDELDAAYRAGGHLLVWCNPHNPLGRAFTEPEMTAVCEVVDAHGGRVFADEIHAPLTYDGRRHIPYASLSETAADHTITAVSASKAWNLPGLKCAQLVIANQADARLLAGLDQFVTHGASNLGVVANTTAYTSGGPWLADVLAYLDGNRHALASLLERHLPGVGCFVPEATYLAWLDFRKLGLGDHPGEFFKEKAGVVLTDGPACGEPGRGHARLNFATPRPILERIVMDMAAAVEAPAA